MSALKIILPGTRVVQATFIRERTKLGSKSLQELVDSYNIHVDLGIVGALAQGIVLAAIHAEFLKRTAQSPVVLEHGCVLSLGERVCLREGVLWFEDGGRV